MAPRTTDTHTISVRKERDSRGRLGLPTYRLDLPGIKLEMTKTILETRSIYCAHQPLVSIQESNPGETTKMEWLSRPSLPRRPCQTCILPKENITLCGDPTRDQRIKSPTLYQTELRRPWRTCEKTILVKRGMFCKFHQQYHKTCMFCNFISYLEGVNIKGHFSGYNLRWFDSFMWHSAKRSFFF